MKSILTQNQIDDLVKGIGTGDIEISDLYSDDNLVKLYDFLRPNKFSAEQTKVIREIFSQFIRIFVPRISTFLRVYAEAEVEYVEEQMFIEYYNSISPNSSLAIFDFKPLDGSVIIESSNIISSVVVDLILGGSVSRSSNKEYFSEIEISMLRRFYETLIMPIVESWKNVIELSPKLKSVGIDKQSIQLISQSDIVCIITIKLTLSGIDGLINFCIPYSVIEPVVKQLNSMYLYSGSKIKKEKESLEDYFKEKISSTYIDLTCVLAKTELTFRELAMMQEGDVIRLDKDIGEKVCLVTENSTKFKGAVGKSKNNFVFRIEEVVEVEVEGGGGGVDLDG